MACRMSRRALNAVTARLLAGTSAYVEILVGSVAKQLGYTVRARHSSLVGDLVPGPNVKGDNV